MLPAGARLRRRTDFASTLRAGRGRSGGTGGTGGRGGTQSALLVVHLAADATDSKIPPRAGFVVSRTVGGAVVRNRVRRRLRHLVAARLGGFAPGTRLVVRALPSAAAASWAELETALDSALNSALKSALKSVPGQRP